MPCCSPDRTDSASETTRGRKPLLQFSEVEIGVAQRTLRMLAGETAIFTALLRMLSSTMTRPSPSAIW
jgi:hypothetical protein